MGEAKNHHFYDFGILDVSRPPKANILFGDPKNKHPHQDFHTLSHPRNGLTRIRTKNTKFLQTNC